MTEFVHTHPARKGGRIQLGVAVEHDHGAVNHAGNIGIRLAEAADAIPRRPAQ